jgi:hypothetical protein
MPTDVINEILQKGTDINNKLGEKIGLLKDRNIKFNTDLLEKLNEISSAISAFKNTNIQGLTDTKNKLAEVSNELATTKATLNQNQNQLEIVQANLSAAQNKIQTSNAIIIELERKDKELNEKLVQLQTTYDNKISEIRDEISTKSTEEKNTMQQEFNNQITAINNEKAQLQHEVEGAKLAQTEAVANLTALQNDQENLIVSLGNINSFLTKQLELIDSINVGSPDIEDYTFLLDTIQKGLGGVISNINQAVSAPVNSDTYDKFISLTPDQQTEILDTLQATQQNYIEENIDTTDPLVKNNIRNILSRNYKGHLLKGGKRKNKRKTIKKIGSKRTKKLMKNLKGGYVYSSSKDLDKASSIISASSNSNSNSNSKSKSNKKAHKTKRRSSKQ